MTVRHGRGFARFARGRSTPTWSAAYDAVPIGRRALAARARERGLGLASRTPSVARSTLPAAACATCAWSFATARRCAAMRAASASTVALDVDDANVLGLDPPERRELRERLLDAGDRHADVERRRAAGGGRLAEVDREHVAAEPPRRRDDARGRGDSAPALDTATRRSPV